MQATHSIASANLQRAAAAHWVIARGLAAAAAVAAAAAASAAAAFAAAPVAAAIAAAATGRAADAQWPQVTCMGNELVFVSVEGFVREGTVLTPTDAYAQG